MPDTFSDDPRNSASLELLLYQVGELRKITEDGFDKVNGRIGRIESRTALLEDRMSRSEEREKASREEDHKETPLSGKVILAALGIAGTALGIIAALVQHG